VKLAQSCQSAPTQLISATTDRPSSGTREAGQQTSDAPLMLPTAAVTETVWTFSAEQPDAATAAASTGHAHPAPAITDDREDATPELSTTNESPEAEVLKSETATGASAAAEDERGKIASAQHGTDNDHETLLGAPNKQRTTADIYEDWSAPTATATEVCTALGFDFP